MGDMTRKQRRLTLIGLSGVVLAIAAALVLTALRDEIVFFQTPTDIAEAKVGPGTRFRLGGLVEDGSIERGGGETVRFNVTDTVHVVNVSYTGILPDLFREGQGVVTEGTLDGSGEFVADTVFAKHDENYMPAELVDRMKEDGVWQEGSAKP
jgi:cytochrome c-type biogenesis protein CcmE